MFPRLITKTYLINFFQIFIIHNRGALNFVLVYMNSEAKKDDNLYIILLKRSLMRKKENFISVIMEVIWQKKKKILRCIFRVLFTKMIGLKKKIKIVF